MDTRVRTALQTMKTPPKQQQQHDRVKEKREMLQRSRPMDAGKASAASRSRRERKIALQQDVDKLKKKLRHEENVHRALERAFTRPLGALPRLPPYLPPQTLELLAEVAVLEEEVVRLEEQVVNFRQGLYQEAIYISSSKKTVDNASDLYPCPSGKRSEQSKTSSQCSVASDPPSGNDQSPPARMNSNVDRSVPSPNRIANGKKSLKKPSSCSPASEERRGKENHLDPNSAKINKQSPQKKATMIRTSGLKKRADVQLDDRSMNTEKTEECSQTSTDVTVNDVGVSPNRISEDTLKCLVGIFSGMGSSMIVEAEPAMAPSISGSHDSSDHMAFQDPYDIFPEFGRRDIGPYKSFRSIDEDSIDPNLVTTSPLLIRKLKLLLRKLAMVDLRGLNHQQKLAFWINIYNSCMMNAFLEHGIPSSPQMVVTCMQKAMINVGGHSLSAMTIEHFILRLPYQSKYDFPKGLRNDEMTMRSILGLDWPEPLVTFALSCGSWSSPAVRVYTASQVENELETAKRDYLQAAVGISTMAKLAIPKLLDWYLLDFAKDVESLMDWICLQLPSRLRNDAVKCIERARRGAAQSQNVQVLPYDFSFRYILAR